MALEADAAGLIEFVARAPSRPPVEEREAAPDPDVHPVGRVSVFGETLGSASEPPPAPRVHALRGAIVTSIVTRAVTGAATWHGAIDTATAPPTDLGALARSTSGTGESPPSGMFVARGRDGIGFVLLAQLASGGPEVGLLLDPEGRIHGLDPWSDFPEHTCIGSRPWTDRRASILRAAAPLLHLCRPEPRAAEGRVEFRLQLRPSGDVAKVSTEATSVDPHVVACLRMKLHELSFGTSHSAVEVVGTLALPPLDRSAPP